ncbi:MAG: hypothetical protein J6328_04495 [Bacilli bacterium]|nr:hypothetical protein [Bacilli bacterium]
MLIASIIILSLVVICFVATIILGRHPKAKEFEIKTKASKGLFAIGFVFYFIFGFLFSAVVVFLAAFSDKTLMVFVLLILDGIFSTLTLLLFYFLTAQFEAIKGDKLYIRRFIKIKEFDIKDVRTIDAVPGGYLITGMPDFGFTISSATLHCGRFMELLEERSEKGFSIKNPSSGNEEEALTEMDQEDLALMAIGKEFRENFPRTKRKAMTVIIVSSIATVLVVLGIGLAFFLSSEKDRGIDLMILAIPLGLVYALAIAMIHKNMDKQLNLGDRQLGYLHRFDNKKVKGAAKAKWKVSLISLSAISVGLLLLASLTSAAVFGLSKPVPQEHLVTVSGEFEYVRKIGGRNSNYAIGLKGDATEYRISSVYYRFLDDSFFGEATPGMTLYLALDPESEPSTLKYEGKTHWTNFYTIKSDAKEYLSYEGYLKAYNRNADIGKGLFITFASMSVVALASTGVSYAVYKSRAKKETIEINGSSN